MTLHYLEVRIERRANEGDWKETENEVGGNPGGNVKKQTGQEESS
jgi:hypothetical protein